MLFADVRYCVRSLRRSPGFTAAIMTMALAIGANTAIFSVVNAVLIRPLPFASPDRLMQVTEKNDKLGVSNYGASVLNYLSWKELDRSFEALGAVGFATFTLTGRGDPEQLTGGNISPCSCHFPASVRCSGVAFKKTRSVPGRYASRSSVRRCG